MRPRLARDVYENRTKLTAKRRNGKWGKGRGVREHGVGNREQGSGIRDQGTESRGPVLTTDH